MPSVNSCSFCFTYIFVLTWIQKCKVSLKPCPTFHGLLTQSVLRSISSVAYMHWTFPWTLLDISLGIDKIHAPDEILWKLLVFHGLIKVHFDVNIMFLSPFLILKSIFYRYKLSYWQDLEIPWFFLRDFDKILAQDSSRQYWTIRKALCL